MYFEHYNMLFFFFMNVTNFIPRYGIFYTCFEKVVKLNFIGLKNYPSIVKPSKKFKMLF